MSEFSRVLSVPTKRVGTIALATVMACSLSFPQLAFATVKVDETELAQGENAIGNGSATLQDSSLDMVGVKGYEFFTDEDLTVNFNGGNDFEYATAAGSANVDMNFEGENEVEDIIADENASLTINANGNNNFEEVAAGGDSSVLINVTGENDFESIQANDNASITVRGTTCQKRDTINLGEGEKTSYIATSSGDLNIDHVTVNLNSEEATIGSVKGNVAIDTSKIAKDDGNECAEIHAGGTMAISESVIDIAGTLRSADEMTIQYSDVKVEEPDAKHGDPSPYRVYSNAGIKLVGEKNGTVKEGDLLGKKVFYVDTGNNSGIDVDLKAIREPGYYKCADEKPSLAVTPKTGDSANPFLPLAAGVASAATAAFAARRKEMQQ